MDDSLLFNTTTFHLSLKPSRAPKGSAPRDLVFPSSRPSLATHINFAPHSSLPRLESRRRPGLTLQLNDQREPSTQRHDEVMRLFQLGIGCHSKRQVYSTKD
jgi:hypothetical protein